MCIWYKKETSIPWQPGAAWHYQLGFGVVTSLCTHSMFGVHLLNKSNFTEH